MIKNYNWNIRNWIKRVIGRKRELEDVVALYFVFLKPLQNVVDENVEVVRDIDFRLKYSAEQGVLAGLLNRLFDADDSRIRVETLGEWREYIRFRTEGGSGFVFFRTESPGSGKFVRFRGEVELANVVRVFAPSSISAQEKELESWIEFYLPSARSYEIIFE